MKIRCQQGVNQIYYKVKFNILGSMSKNILITGAAGFIGFHLAKALRLGGNQVTGYDNFNDYYSISLKRDRAALLKKEGISVIEGDVTDELLLPKIVKEQGISHIVHLAAQAGVRYSLVNPQAYIKSNVDGFLNVLEICRRDPRIKLTYASSSSVYGLNTKIPFSEGDRTDNQASLYGVTKKANESMAQTYNHLFGISAVGLRFFTVYGPWGRPDMAYFSFTKAILEERPIEVFNHGQLKRDFTYIDDIVTGISSAMEFGNGCEIFNLGNNQPVDLLEFIEVLEKKLGKKAIKKNMPMQQGDVLVTYADIENSIQKLGYVPKTKLHEGIPRFVDWYLQHHSTK